MSGKLPGQAPGHVPGSSRISVALGTHAYALLNSLVSIDLGPLLAENCVWCPHAHIICIYGRMPFYWVPCLYSGETCFNLQRVMTTRYDNFVVASYCLSEYS